MAKAKRVCKLIGYLGILIGEIGRTICILGLTWAFFIDDFCADSLMGIFVFVIIGLGYIKLGTLVVLGSYYVATRRRAEPDWVKKRKI